MLMQMVTDLMFMKQALVYVLKETNETDRLIDQCMTALTSRCCIVNTDPDASNSSKTSYMSDNDMSMVHLIEDCTSNKNMSRTISDGLLILNRVCVLFQR